jgi:hypothetical protein
MTNNLFVLRHKESQLFVSRGPNNYLFFLVDWLPMAIILTTTHGPLLRDVLRKECWPENTNIDLEFELLEIGFSVTKTVTLEAPCL